MNQKSISDFREQNFTLTKRVNGCMETDGYSSLSLGELLAKKTHIECLLEFLEYVKSSDKDCQSNEESYLHEYCKWLLDQVSWLKCYTCSLPSLDDLLLSPDTLNNIESLFLCKKEELRHQDEICDIENFEKVAHETTTYFFAEDLCKKW